MLVLLIRKKKFHVVKKLISPNLSYAHIYARIKFLRCVKVANSLRI